MSDDALLQSWIALIARICMATLYLVSAVRQVIYREPVIREMKKNGISPAGPVLVCAIILQLVCGISLALGLWARTGAILLFIFTAVATWIYYRDLRDKEQFLHALKNVAILGGLLMVAAAGPGRLSLG